jgi:hypothetical protein
MKIINTVLVCAAFLTMLAATSKKKPPPPKREPVIGREVPATTGWARNELHGIVFLTPPFATLDREASTATQLVVRFGDIAAAFSNQPDIRTDPVAARELYANDQYVYGYFVEAKDALVAVKWDSSSELPNLGEYCEVTACSAPIDGKPFCARASYSSPKKSKLSPEQCLEVVAIARSITKP